MTTEQKQMTETAEAEVQREYGFTVMVQKDGNIVITPHNLMNDFEFVGLAEYVSRKKDDVLKTVGMSLEARTLQSIGLLAKALSGLVQERTEADSEVG